MSTEDKGYDVGQPALADGPLHLAGSGDDAELAAQLEADETLAALGASLRPVQPSPGLRVRLLEEVSQALSQETVAQATVQEGVAPGTQPDLKVVPRLKVAAQTEGRPQVDGQPETRQAAPSPSEPAGVQVVELASRRRWLGTALRVAASVALLATGVGIGRWSTLDAMAPTEHFAYLNQAQDVHRVTDTMPDGHVATLTWSPDMSMTALSLPDQMMADSAGSSLQVWLRKDGQTTSLGLYDPQQGNGFTFLDLMPQEGEQVLITLEPEGGSTQPTGEALVTFDVNADGTTTRQPQEQPTADSQA